MENMWDKASQRFNTHVNEGEIDPGTADNILIAWPPIIDLINKTFPNKEGLSALDFGCGTGGFSNKLKNLGFKVTAVDPSEKMIEIAKNNLPSDIKLIDGDQNTIKDLENFNLITAIMSLQFINDAELFQKLSNKLTKGGLLIFAVFNKKFVKAYLEKQILFKDFDNEQNPSEGKINFGNGVEINVYINEAEFYDSEMKNLGFIKLLEENPPFTKEFNEKYPGRGPRDVSEYLILGYKK